MVRSKFLGHMFDFGKIAHHLAPAIPERIIGVVMKRPLECSHAMFEVHLKKMISRFNLAHTDVDSSQFQQAPAPSIGSPSNNDRAAWGNSESEAPNEDPVIALDDSEFGKF